jgi:endonuclease YncB( thermonuclease family)
MMLRRITFLLGFLLAARADAGGPDLPGPFPADVIKVVDGDTIAVKAQIWIGIELSVDVRIRGIDAPEIRGRCREEAILATAATDRLIELAGASIVLSQVREDKYGGRVLADVANVSGDDIGAEMLKSGLARPYEGGRRGGWCEVAGLPG